MVPTRNLVVCTAWLIYGVAFAQDSQPAPTPHPLTPEQRGDVLMARKMYREAIDYYQQAPQNSAVIWNKMGIAYHQMSQLDAAMKRYQRAMRLDSKYPEAINNLGTVYYAQKRYGHAAGLYKRALKLSPDSASIYSNLGTAYFAEKKYKEAALAYDKALHLDPDIFEHHSTYGVLLEDRTVE